jgi:hypothetical protein
MIVQRLFVTNELFDKAMIIFIRKLTKNFILAHSNRSINGLPIENAPIVENEMDG